LLVYFTQLTTKTRLMLLPLILIYRKVRKFHEHVIVLFNRIKWTFIDGSTCFIRYELFTLTITIYHIECSNMSIELIEMSRSWHFIRLNRRFTRSNEQIELYDIICWTYFDVIRHDLFVSSVDSLHILSSINRHEDDLDKNQSRNTCVWTSQVRLAWASNLSMTKSNLICR
jgi:hypothetical protein